MKTLLKSINYPRMALMGLLGFLMPYGLTGLVIAYSMLTSTNPRHEDLEVFDLSSREVQSVFIGFYDATLHRHGRIFCVELFKRLAIATKQASSELNSLIN